MEGVEDLAVNVPAVEDRVEVAAQVGGGRWRELVFEKVAVAGTANDDASLAVASEEDAEAAGVEVEAVGFGQPGEGVPDEDDLEIGPLKIGRVHDNPIEAASGEGHAEEVFLVVVRDADRDLFGAEGSQAELALAAVLGSAVEQPTGRFQEREQGVRIRLRVGSRGYCCCGVAAPYPLAVHRICQQAASQGRRQLRR